MKLSNRLYYAVKPFIPYCTKMRIRRWYAHRQLQTASGQWPILPGSEKKPRGWPGWPEDKQFAVVLTHDVEGQRGLDRCPELMASEEKRGFVSSFNFVPEGEYRVSRGLREQLCKSGFEVGIHDLHHDGSLYRSRHGFVEKALRINQYLKEWDAVGFRAGFMLHNLEWLHDLHVDYDASTFDSDPFEPQPDGMHTIFPFWVPPPPTALQSPVCSGAKSNRGYHTSDGANGYVELPYTLAQDSTLFLLLGESQPDIWLQKVDWVANHGGMVLVNTHPDYMAMAGAGKKPWEYPMRLYENLLEYIRSRYPGAYWQALPRDVAQFVRNSNMVPRPVTRIGTVASPVRSPARSRSSASVPAGSGLEPARGKRAAVVVFADYLTDTRPRREAEALAQLGMEVDVISLKENEGDSLRETVNGVNILRLPLKHWRGNKLGYVFHYGIFTLSSLLLLGFRSLVRRYSIVHVHNMPDFLVFAALVPKIFGAKVILDLHDPMPELMMTIFGLERESFYVRLLKWLEKISTGFANLVLTPNLSFEKLFAGRSCRQDKLHVVLNSPDEEIFKYRDCEAQAPVRRDSSKPFVIMYHGAIVERHGVDLAVLALEKARRSIPNAELRLYGVQTRFLSEVMELAREHGLEKSVQYLGAKSLEQIAELIDHCDVGIIPNRRSTFTEINFPTRIFEYLARGKPVIAPATAGIQDYFGRDKLLFIEMGNADDLAEKLGFVFSNPQETSAIVKRGQAVYRAHTWGKERARFWALVCGLFDCSGGKVRTKALAKRQTGAAITVLK